jgi:hypothetical protein
MPVRVIALTVMYNELIYRTLWAGEEVPQKMAEVIKDSPIK